MLYFYVVIQEMCNQNVQSCWVTYRLSYVHVPLSSSNSATPVLVVCVLKRVAECGFNPVLYIVIFTR